MIDVGQVLWPARTTFHLDQPCTRYDDHFTVAPTYCLPSLPDLIVFIVDQQEIERHEICPGSPRNSEEPALPVRSTAERDESAFENVPDAPHGSERGLEAAGRKQKVDVPRRARVSVNGYGDSAADRMLDAIREESIDHP